MLLSRHASNLGQPRNLKCYYAAKGKRALFPRLRIIIHIATVPLEQDPMC